MSRVAVVVPWQTPGSLHRQRALTWVLRQYAEHCSWPVLIASLSDGGGWCKAKAVTPIVEATDAEIVVVADADVWCDNLPAAVDAVEGGGSWAIPHDIVYRLSEHATGHVLSGGEPDRDDLAQRPYRGVKGGGIVVLKRDTYLQVPLDPRFVGWGQEDLAWSIALQRLVGSPWRGDGALIHLWHEPPERMNRRVGSHAGQALFRRYATARRNPEEMRRLIEEVQAHDARLAA